MNYGKKATQKKLRDAASNTHKLTSRLFLGFIRTLLFAFLIVTAAGISTGIGMIKGIIYDAPEINIESIVPQ